MKKIFYVFTTLLIFVPFHFTHAQGFKNISAVELNKILERKERITLVDARTEAEFRDGHIPGSINIPPERLSFIGTLLPKDRQKTIVFYCRGIG